MKRIILLVFLIFGCQCFGENVSIGEWVKDRAPKVNSWKGDPDARRLLESIATKKWIETIWYRQDIPFEFSKAVGDSLYVYRTCRNSCSEITLFVYDTKVETGFFLLGTVDPDENPSPADVISGICTRGMFNQRYQKMARGFLDDEGVKISNFWYDMKTSVIDSQVERRHAVALSLYRSGRIDESLDSLLPIRSVDESNLARFPIEAWNDLGFFLEEDGRSAEAIGVLERVVADGRMEPNGERIPAYLNLGDAYMKSGDTTKAKLNYKRYVELMEGTGKGSKVPSRVRDYLKN